jgi:endonuclease G, mitochondrial
MAKKKKPKPSFPSIKPWLAALIAGIAIGISSQHIPQVRAYTKEVFMQESPLPGYPVSSFLIHCPSYSLVYDARNRNPAWVYEHLTAESVKKEADRSHAGFKEDDSIPQHLRAKLGDYKGQGFDRGLL